MNFRRILVSSGSHLWKRAFTRITVPASENSHLWKRACTTVAAPASDVVGTSFAAPASDVVVTSSGASGSAQKAKMASKKRKMFKKLRSLRETGGSVAMTLNELMWEEEEEGVSVTQTDLIRWAKLLDKHSENQHALEIFQWMSRNKMTFSPSEHAIYLDLIAKTKGVEAAQAYFDYLDPNFDNMYPREKNWPAYQKLWDWHLKDYPVTALVNSDNEEACYST